MLFSFDLCFDLCFVPETEPESGGTEPSRNRPVVEPNRQGRNPMSRATKLWPALGTRFKEIPNWFLINEGVEVSEGCHDEVAENNHCALEPKVCQNYIH